MKKAVLLWVLVSIPITGLCLGMYAVGQQVYRQSLNDPQIQMAEDGALRLSAGGVPADVVPRGNLIDMKASLSPWIAVYDSKGRVLEADAQLDNAPPQPPQSVFDDASWNNAKTYTVPAGKETRLTWQPEPGVRQGLILVRYASPQGSGYVAAGRNMRVVEERIIQLGENMLIGWLLILAASFACILCGIWLWPKN